MTLAEITNWAWYEKVKNRYTPVLPIDLSEALRLITNKREKNFAFEEIVRPFSIGGAYIDYGDMKLVDGTPVPKKVARQLAEIRDKMDIPNFGFTGDHNGQAFKFSLVFQVHPMIADYDVKKAYHRVIVGLAFTPQIVDGEVIEPSPEDWPKEDQNRFWEQLLEEVDRFTSLVVPKLEPEESVVLNFNGQLEVPASYWRVENRAETIKQIADKFPAGTQLVGLNVQEGGKSFSTVAQNCPVCGWVHDGGFTQLKNSKSDAISLSGILPNIVGLVHKAHEKGLSALSTKDDALVNLCQGYRHPCKAFDDLDRREAYKLLFDTRRRGFISLRRGSE